MRAFHLIQKIGHWAMDGRKIGRRKKKLKMHFFAFFSCFIASGTKKIFLVKKIFFWDLPFETFFEKILCEDDLSQEFP